MMKYLLLVLCCSCIFYSDERDIGNEAQQQVTPGREGKSSALRPIVGQVKVGWGLDTDNKSGYRVELGGTTRREEGAASTGFGLRVVGNENGDYKESRTEGFVRWGRPMNSAGDVLLRPYGEFFFGRTSGEVEGHFYPYEEDWTHLGLGAGLEVALGTPFSLTGGIELLTTLEKPLAVDADPFVFFMFGLEF
jgi:hypothetical protein